MAAPLSTSPHAPELIPAPRLLARWPLPAVCAWCGAWAVAALAARSGVDASSAQLAGSAAGAMAALTWPGLRPTRRLWLALGYPLLGLLLGHAALPAWAWLLPLALLLALYPVRAWRDAPLFPTPPSALRGLAARAVLPAGARVLDAGCGVGDGLRALRREYPHARIEGVEHSRVLAWVARWRERAARVQRGDMWARSWADFDLVYLFQRPESMARAWQKACADMRPGTWLVSLEFEVNAQPPVTVLRRSHRRCVWIYRVPAPPAAGQPAPAAKQDAEMAACGGAPVHSRRRRRRR